MVPSIKKFPPEKVWVDREVEGHPLTRKILGRVGVVCVETVDDVHGLKRIGDLSKAKREWIITKHRGRAFKPCQGIGEDHICCCYHVIDLISGCPMDCSYCILQHYLENNPRTTIFVNIDEILDQVNQALKEDPDKFFRIGTGELGDSLALDSITGHAGELIPFFAEQTNAILELKTKTDSVDHLLDLPHNGNTVVSWSVNAEPVIEGEERFTASLKNRFAAARKCVEAGYPVGFHFDPIILSGDSSDEMLDYMNVIDRMFDAVDSQNIAWVSLGLLRLPYQMKAIVQHRFPDTRIFSGELVPAGGKMRYARFLREDYYRPLWNRLVKRLPPQKIYLCMETANVWNKLDPQITCHERLEDKLVHHLIEG